MEHMQTTSFRLFLSITLLSLIACNSGQQTPSNESPYNTTLDDSSTVVNEKLIQVDSVTTAQEKQLDSLITATFDNNISLVKKLIHRGANANGKIFRARYSWDSPLSEAVRRNHTEIAKILLAAGADPNLDLGENRTPFHYSIGGCSLDVRPCSDTLFNLLLTHGGRVNTYNKYHDITPLSSAIESGDLNKATVLIKHGAVLEPDSLNGFQPPLAVAVRYLQYDMVSLLLKHGANVNATYSEIYEDCIRCPADITIIHALVHMDEYEDKHQVERILDLVLQYKPDLNIENTYHFTPLEFAAFGNNTALIDKLLKHGANLETRGNSVLHCAAQLSNLQILEHLLKKEINVNIKDFSGNTPLHLSLNCCGDGFGEGITELRRAQTIELLLNHGADPTIVNNNGESFLQECKKSTYKEVTKVLIKRRLLKAEDIISK